MESSSCVDNYLLIWLISTELGLVVADFNQDAWRDVQAWHERLFRTFANMIAKKSMRIRELISQRAARKLSGKRWSFLGRKEKRRSGKDAAAVAATGRGRMENERVREEERNSEGPCGVSQDIKSYYVYAMPPPKYSLLRYRVLMELL